MKAIKSGPAWATRQDKPTLIACKTKIGKGAATMEGSHKTHGAALGAAEIAATRLGLAWDHEPFDLPEDDRHGLEEGRQARRQGAQGLGSPSGRLVPGRRLHPRHEGRPARRRLRRPERQDRRTDRDQARPGHAPVVGRGAGRSCSAPSPRLIGGSADLTGSNNTFVKDTPILDAPTYAGRYVNWGIREFGMAAAMNGMALHGGVIPYGGTFMVFSDYSRPAIRMAALMGIRVIHVLTHDSIGLGEDGPTHQPVEHLAALRAIPNLLVFRPADTVEAMECWQIALEHKNTPSAMALSRQKTPGRAHRGRLRELVGPRGL